MRTNDSRLLYLSTTDIPVAILYSPKFYVNEKVYAFKLMSKDAHLLRSNTEIAAHLGVSLRTAQTFTQRIRKMGLYGDAGMVTIEAMAELDLEPDKRFAPKRGLRYKADKWKHAIETIVLFSLSNAEVLVYAHLNHKNLDYWHGIHGTVPGTVVATLDEITSAVGLSRPTVVKALAGLRDKYLIEKDGHRHGIIGPHVDGIRHFASLAAMTHATCRDQEILTALGLDPAKTWMAEAKAAHPGVVQAISAKSSKVLDRLGF